MGRETSCVRAAERLTRAGLLAMAALALTSGALLAQDVVPATLSSLSFSPTSINVGAADQNVAVNWAATGNVGIYYRWAPGNEAKSEPALRRALELGTKYLETSRTDFNLRANLAEYRARLGDAKGALAEVDAIPAGAVRGGAAWNWVSSNPVPFSGKVANQSALAAGIHQQYFVNATNVVQVELE